MHVLIVDDERPARDKLRRLLMQEADVIKITEAKDAVDALSMINEDPPDVAFFDIQMPELSGIELAASLTPPTPLIAFVTAYDQFAIQAFEANAVDYLLKPFDQSRLQKTLQRLRERLKERASTKLSSTKPSTVQAGLAHYPIQQLIVPDRGVSKIILVAKIDWIETADNYVVLHTGKEQTLMRQTLESLVNKLGRDFFRCHRRAAVRLSSIKKIITLEKGDAELQLNSDARVPCSRQYRAQLLELMRETSTQF